MYYEPGILIPLVFFKLCYFEKTADNFKDDFKLLRLEINVG